MKKLFLYSSIAIAAFTASCREMDDNISPNNVDPSAISPRQLLAASENIVFSTQAGTLNSLSNVWTNTWAGNYYYYGNPLTIEYSLDISNNFSTGIWSSSYITSANLQNIINNGSDLPLHSAIAKILQAYTLQYVVDFYGDAPYSEAFQRQQNLTPKYDNDADIYKALVLKVNEAIAQIELHKNNITSEIVVSPTEDVIFQGDVEKWEKFAKNVKLKLLLRQSKVTDSSIKTFVDQQLQTLATASTADFYTDNVTINPGYSNQNAATVNPIYNNYGVSTYTGALNTGGWRLYKLSEYYANNVNGTTYGSGAADLRGTKQFRRFSTSEAAQAANTARGIKQGGSKPAGSSETQYSYIAGDFVGGNFETYYTYLGSTTDGANIAADKAGQDGYLALNSENKLLLAEAATLYPSIFTFNAQSLYQSAVQDSFAFYKLTSTQATTYLNGLNATTVGWAGAPSKIAAIQYQRLVCLANLRQVETYVNYLKTGYPVIPNADTAIYPNKPYRLIYPLSEYTGNSSNVPNVTQAQVFVKNQYTPFWNQN